VEQYVARNFAFSIEERLVHWRAAEQAAAKAEADAASLAPGALDARASELRLTARRLRDEADREFAAITRAIRMDDSPASTY